MAIEISFRRTREDEADPSLDDDAADDAAAAAADAAADKN